MPPRHGKLLADDTPVLTTQGWKDHGDLVPGDYVYSTSGIPTKILAVSEKQPCNVAVTFTDGETIVAHENHLWAVWRHGSSQKRILETKEIEKKLTSGSCRNGDARNYYTVEYCQPLQNEEKDLLVDPYFFGVWLGDGKSTGWSICGDPADMVVIEGRIQYKPSWQTAHKDTGVRYVGYKGLPWLARNNLINNKHIPIKFLLASENQRRELLRGIVDTDGSTCPKTGRIRIVTVSKRLAEDVSALLATLGYRATTTKQDPHLSSSGIQGNQPVYTVQYTPHDESQQAYLPRKNVKKRGLRRMRSIAGIKRVAPRIGQCIQVEDPSGEYLVGRTLIPTHNSELVSKYFPSWYLGVFPQRKMLIGSAGKELATDFSAQSRDLLIEHGAAFGVSVREDKRGAGAWELDQGGKYRAVSVGAAVFGYGAHIAVIDDYCGSIADALSQAERDATHRWYHGTIRNRLESEDSGIVIVATRYHKNDLVGRLLKEQAEGGDQWRVLSLPALCVTANDAMGRKPGEALWPDRWSSKHLEAERKALGISGYPWMFEALYQGTPLDVIDSEWPAEYFGDHIWFDEWPHPSEIVSKVMYVDPSLGKSSKSDYSAIIMLARDMHGDYYIDADLGRRPSVKIAEDALLWHQRFRPVALGWEVQDADLLKAEVMRQASELDEDVWFLAITNRLNKLVRIRSLSPYLDARRLRFRRNSPGVNLLLEQMRAFPAHKHDDGPDALEGAIRLERQLSAGEIVEDDNEQEYLRA